MVRTGTGSYLILLLVIFISGCSTTEPVAKNEPELYLASLYNPSQLSLHPEFSIYHESNDFSTLYIRAYPSEFRFSQANEDAEYRALLRLNYRLVKLNEESLEGVVVDSASIRYKLEKKDESRSAFFASLSIPVQAGNRYLMRIQTQDLQRGSIGLTYLYIDKTNPYGSQNFKVISKYSGYPKFMRFFMPEEAFTIQYRDPSVDSIYVDYYTMSSELPRPPVTASSDYTISRTPDTTFILPLTDSITYNLTKQGMYFIKVAPELNEGLTLFNFGNTFPQVKTPRELLEPLFYLATLAEYRDLRRESNVKLAVDNFWLKRGNSIERSRELIRIYYNRVVYSNLYFTSNKEGWKTDRGMIFILFGPPNRIQMTANGERWYYFARRKGKIVEFQFIRQPDKYSYNHLEWKKTTESLSFWNDAVRSWRNGKVYSMGG